MAYQAIFSRRDVFALINRLNSTTTMQEAIGVLRETLATLPVGGGWATTFQRLIDGLEGTGPGFKIFTKGNSKLPFWSFSSLAIASCPGAGECVQWCYSLKAWAHPQGLGRQLQNWLLMRFDKKRIAMAYDTLPAHLGSLTLRLYVDGDFSCMQDVAFWFRLLKTRPEVDAYGYSKSLDLLVEWHTQGLEFPTNYKLNLSTGGKHDDSPVWQAAETLPITRGIFSAVQLKGKYSKSSRVKYADPAYHKEVRELGREKYGKPVVSCPGFCGECAHGKHLCSSAQGVVILIGAH